MSVHLVPAVAAPQADQPAWFGVTRHAGGARAVTLATCIGCGAMERFAGCEDGCSEEQQDLVSGADHDAVGAAARACAAAVEAFGPLVACLAQDRAVDDEPAVVYEQLRAAARLALAAHPAEASAVLDADPVVRTAWGCPRCGGLEAPEPCLGICIRRPAEWIDAGDHAALRDRALADRAEERALRGVLELLVAVTPRAGAWARGLGALSDRAGAALGARA